MEQLRFAITLIQLDELKCFCLVFVFFFVFFLSVEITPYFRIQVDNNDISQYDERNFIRAAIILYAFDIYHVSPPSQFQIL